MVAKSRGHLPAYISVHVATLLFGLAGVLGDHVGLNALEVTFGRTLFASIALAAVTCYVGKRLSISKMVSGSIVSGQNALLIFSGALLAVHWVIFFASIHHSTVAIGLVMFSTCPVFVALLEPIVFKERFNPWSIIAALCVVVGVFVMSGAYRGELLYVNGILLGIFSGLSFAILQLVNRSLAGSAGSVTTSFVQNTVASLSLLPFVWFGLGAIQSQQWVILLFLGVGCTALAHTLFIYSLKYLKVANASLIAAGLEPVYGIALAALILSQLPGYSVLAGGAIILGTVVLMTYKSFSGNI